MAMSVTWDPRKYLQFGDHRNRPFFDLTAQVRAQTPAKVIDLGCGPGNLTASLAQRWPDAEVIGIDSSPEMIAQASHDHAAHNNLSFQLGDISTFTVGDADVVVTNAALQWVPGHQQLLAGWARELKPGGWFALQVPGNFNAPSHVLMREFANSAQWASRLAGVLRHEDAVSEPAAYLNILLDAGLQANAWETSYQQVLQGEDPVLNWVRGTGLRPIVEALGTDAPAFEEPYAAALRDAYPATAHGTVFPFRRIFAVGHKPEGTA